MAWKVRSHWSWAAAVMMKGLQTHENRRISKEVKRPKPVAINRLRFALQVNEKALHIKKDC